jgi:hypothetical protein
LSHDAQLILAVLGVVVVAVVLYAGVKRLGSFLSVLVKFAQAVISIDTQLKEFIPKYLAQGEPLAAVPNILKAQVGGLMALKETMDAFSKTILGNTRGGHIEPDERAEASEDAILQLIESAAAKGQHISREEAMERLESQRMWGRMRTLIPTGSDD